jgi:predicted enzyme related to lactoylglutathione lyase
MESSAKTTKPADNNDTAPPPVAWFEIAGKDGVGLRSFYRELFGWKTYDVAPGSA